nr:RHS repeat-associated core domain-containing protein [Pseudomonas syringae group genomosp. 3]
MQTLKRLVRKFGIVVLVMLVTNLAVADTVTYFHNDISGSPLAATDGSGNLLWKENYKPYGEKLSQAAPIGSNKIGFHGKAFDDDTGLSYMGARYYDPVLGRFMGMDPVDFQENNLHSFNRYTYVNNNPYKYVDPNGEYAFLIAPVIYALTALAGAVTVSSALSGGSGDQLSGDPGSVGTFGNDIDSTAKLSSGNVFQESSSDSDADKLRDGQIEHGDKRAEEAKTDASRQVGDRNKVVENGKRYVDSDTGHDVHVSGNRVVITNESGDIVSNFVNSRKNTNNRVVNGKWVPKD